MLAAEIHLLPDWTVFVQLGIFLLTLTVLHIFVFRPTLHLLEKRKKFTADARVAAGKFGSDADELDKKRAQIISGEMEKTDTQAAVMLADKRREAEKIIFDARVEAKRILESAETSVEISEQAVALEMKKKAGELAKDIAARVMN